MGRSIADDHLTRRIIQSAMAVHRELGPGLLESTYRRCLCWELEKASLAVRSELELPLEYRGHHLGRAFRLDLVVESQVIIEVKAVEVLTRLHESQLLTYLRLTGLRRGLLLNFNVPLLRDGIRRLVL